MCKKLGPLCIGEKLGPLKTSAPQVVHSEPPLNKTGTCSWSLRTWPHQVTHQNVGDRELFLTWFIGLFVIIYKTMSVSHDGYIIIVNTWPCGYGTLCQPSTVQVPTVKLSTMSGYSSMARHPAGSLWITWSACYLTVYIIEGHICTANIYRRYRVEWVSIFYQRSFWRCKVIIEDNIFLKMLRKSQNLRPG